MMDKLVRVDCKQKEKKIWVVKFFNTYFYNLISIIIILFNIYLVSKGCPAICYEKTQA